MAPFLAPEWDDAFRTGRAKADGGTIYYTIPGVSVYTYTSGAVSANTDYYGPWVARTPIVIDQLAAEIASSAGTNFRIGFYAADTDWQPVGAPLADSGNLDASTTGVKTYSPGSPIVVPRGRYVSVFNADSTPSLRAVRGNPDGMPVDTGMGGSGQIQFISVGRTLAAFPTPGTRWTTATAGTLGIQHVVFYRVSAA